MNANWNNRLPLVILAALLVAAVIFMARSASARADKDAAPTSGPRYTVVETEGHNLIVTDNQSNTLYFYTIDRDKPIGSELKLRGTLDLTKVGERVIKPKKSPPG